MAKQEDTAPDILSPEWNDYVLDQLVPGEFFTHDKLGKVPVAAGVRRLVEKLVGEIISSKVVGVITDPIEGTSTGRVIVQYEVQVKPFNSDIIKTYGDVDRLIGVHHG